MNSLVSYPDRGPYGKNSYRGNTTGYIIRDLISHFQPRTFLDICQGSGTSADVAREMGIQYFGLDLHTGFDFTTQSALQAIGGTPVDLCFSHPPYAGMIDYVQERKKHGLAVNANENDLSQCKSIPEFLAMSEVMLLNQREATRKGGVYTTLIGDMRKNGQFHSFQADFIKMMPPRELLSVVIKAQHNVRSASTSYPGSTIFILHEYLLVFRKSSESLVQITWEKATQFQQSMHATWRAFIRIALMNLGGKATLHQIYQEVLSIAESKVANNPNYQAKIRQTLQLHFVNVQRGVWTVGA